MLNAFTISEISAITGVPYDTLQYWRSEGALTAREIRGTKKKPTILFNRQDCFACCVAANLQRQGMHGQVLYKVVRFLCKADIEKRLAAGEKFLVIVNGTSVFACTPLAVFQTQTGPRTVSFVTVDLVAAQRHFEARLPVVLAETRERLKLEQVAELTA